MGIHNKCLRLNSKDSISSQRICAPNLLVTAEVTKIELYKIAYVIKYSYISYRVNNLLLRCIWQ